ncbi:PhzF family phenazine biosynthesis protein [Pseudoxanthomonas sp. CAU 1598]|uniref:PhzF family phenazine biosynthesis protein n=2 Tax=Pseudomarimonas arenosa TaxID=2774145 RepID=A0AAW3ZEF0_9GAMM|nr:PhzF family phenazine biosynthesis protein [Pseudomarimonas arenosa]
MARLEYWQIDVFAHRRGGGNPLGVVLDGQGWSDAAMQSFARWTDLVETTFVLPPSSKDADYRLRIFTPSKEIPFAGHPSIGSAHALLQSARLTPRNGQLVQECGAGLLPIRVIERPDAAPELFVKAPKATVIGADCSAVDQLFRDAPHAPSARALVEGGRRWWLVEMPELADLQSWRPAHAATEALARATDTLGVCVFVRTDIDGRAALAVRAFPAGAGIVEDPASGAANGLIAAWLAEREPEGALSRGYPVTQGREMGHDARIEILIESQHAVWVGGHSNTIVRGEVEWAT